MSTFRIICFATFTFSFLPFNFVNCRSASFKSGCSVYSFSLFCLEFYTVTTVRILWLQETIEFAIIWIAIYICTAYLLVGCAKFITYCKKYRQILSYSEVRVAKLWLLFLFLYKCVYICIKIGYCFSWWCYLIIIVIKCQ